MQSPRMKSVFPPVPIGDGLIRIADIDAGIASELIDDEQGNTWRLMELMDGTRTVPELVAVMRAEQRDVSASEIEAAVAALYDAGFVDDGATPLPEQLSAAELERYHRNIEFFSYFHRPPATAYDFQVRLKEAKVTVLGLGGLGSYVALSLVALGVGDILLVDFDDVELSNLNRQILYTDSDIGRAKVDASFDRLRQINPHVRITTRNLKVDGVDAARSIMTGRDFIVCAADRPRVRIYDWLNEAALAENIAWLRGAQAGLTVQLVLHVPGRTACFQCVETTSKANVSWYEPETRYWTETIGDRTVNPCMAPLAGMVGNLAALEATKFLTGMQEPVTLGRTLVFDLQRLQTDFIELERNSDCPSCAVGVPAGVGG